MSEADHEDRTEQPSEKRLREARERGDVPRSRELANVAVAGSAALAVLAMGPAVGRAAQDWMRGALTLDPAMLGQHDRLPAHAASLFLTLLLPVLPLVLVALAACLIAPLAMGGLRFTTSALQPDLARLDPLKGLARLYSRENLVELLRSLLRVLLVGAVGAWAVQRAVQTMPALAGAPLEQAVGDGLGFALTTLLATLGALALLAAADVPWQHWSWRNRLKMTRQELRDELKETEGNPEVKARVRQVARQLAQRRMMEAVPTADVVVTNPTHYAVALKYDAGRMRAPRVVARGVDEVALRIRELAARHRVSVVEAPALARALYRHAGLDQEIPVSLYAAVAQVLSYVYQLRRWHPAHGPMPVLGAVAVDPALSDPPADGAPTR